MPMQKIEGIDLDVVNINKQADIQLEMQKKIIVKMNQIIKWINKFVEKQEKYAKKLKEVEYSASNKNAQS